MILTNHPQKEPSKELCDYLQSKFGLKEEALNLGIRQSKQENAPLPIILRSFGLITLEQFQEILNWQKDN